MTAFLIGAALLAAIALGLLLWPLRRANTAATAAMSSRQQLNAAIYRGQMAELDADRADGDLDEADWRQARQELQRRLLDDGADAPASAAGEPAATGTTKGLATALATVIPAVAATLYFMLGNPAALDPQPHARMPSVEEIERMVAARLEKEPDDPQALWFAGTIAFEREDYAGAIRFWERLLKHVPPDSEDAQSIARSIEEARAGANAARRPKP